ncbi:MAG TPA: 50S ribosomal protein L25 [Candidatus Saccharimonadales bacterium]|nr:50S ribosomal protein L25 [Candidatus Saccharimonadales bacterium]
MSEKVVVSMRNRTAIGKAARRLRAEGEVPAVVYGHGADAQPVAVDGRELEKVYAKAGGNQMIGLKIDDARQKNALIHDVQLDSRTGHILHADFYLVRMDEKIKTEVPLHFTGESTAVYQQEGTLVRPLEMVEVEALPGDLPESFSVDIAILDDFDKTITVGDLVVPAGVDILTPAEELIARVEPPRSDEELEELEAPIDEKAEMPEGAVDEDAEVIEGEAEPTDKEPENKAAGADPAATK